jgi:TP901 family phage tail tape measure protein
MSARADVQAGKAYVTLWVKQDAFTRGMQQAKRQLSQFGADMQAMGRQLVTVSAAAIVPLGIATKTFADFDDAMRAAGAVARASGDQLKAMTEVALELGRTTSFTAVQVAALMTELGRAGFSPEQVNTMTGAVLNLSRATGTDAAVSAGIMAASIRQFGLEADQATRVADSLTGAANGSFTSVEQLGESLSYAGAIANDFGIEIEDALAILGGLGNAGIQGSMAGTALRRLLLITGSEATKLQGIFGVAFMDSAGNARPLVDTLTEVQAATAGLGTAAKAAKFEEAFGDLGITAASVLGKGGQSVRDLAEEIKKAGGVSATTAKQMDAGLGGAFRIIASAAEGVAIAIGKALEGPLQSIVKIGTDVLGIITELVDENKGAIVTFAKVAVAIGAAGTLLLGIGFAASAASVAIGGLLSIVAFATATFSALATIAGGLFALLSSPITLAIVGGAGVLAWVLQVTGALDSLVEMTMTVKFRIDQLFKDLRQTFANTFGGIRDAIGGGDLALAGEIAVTGLQIAFLQGMQALSETVGGVFGNTIATLTNQITGGDFVGAWNTVVLGMASMWESFSAGLVNGFVKATKAVLNAWRNTIDSMANMLLQQAGQGGIFGKFFEAISGVNVQEEMARTERLRQQAAAAGMNVENASADAVTAGEFRDPATQKIADSITGALDAYQGQAAANKAGADAAFAGATAAGASAVSGEISKLQLDLDVLRRQAKDNLEQMKREPSASATGGAEGAKVAANAKGGGIATSSSTATFSGAAAILAGLGGASQNPVVRAQNEHREETKKGTREMLKKMDAQIQAASNMGLWHA